MNADKILIFLSTLLCIEEDKIWQAEWESVIAFLISLHILSV
jgi:hypothetical protein